MTSDGPIPLRGAAAQRLAEQLGLPPETAVFTDQQRADFDAWMRAGNDAWAAANARRTPRAV